MIGDFIDWYVSLSLLDLYWIFALVDFVLAIVLFLTDREYQNAITVPLRQTGTGAGMGAAIFIGCAAVCSLLWPLMAVWGMWSWAVKLFGHRRKRRHEQAQQAREGAATESGTDAVRGPGPGDSDLRP